MPPASNQRVFSRVSSSVHITLRTEQVTIQSVVAKNISLCGVYVQTKKQLALGCECELSLQVAEGEIEISAQGRVVRTEEGGMAIQFLRILGMESVEHLQNLVRCNAQDPEKIEQEFSQHSELRSKSQG